MDLELFKDLTPAERIDMLDANADEVTETDYLKPFNNEEVQANKARFCQLNVKLAEIKADEDDAKAHFKELRDPLKREADQILGNLKQGGTYVKGKLYKMVDREKRDVGFYNEEGLLVSQRKALPSELRTTTLFNMARVEAAKTGTSENV